MLQTAVPIAETPAIVGMLPTLSFWLIWTEGKVLYPNEVGGTKPPSPDCGKLLANRDTTDKLNANTKNKTHVFFISTRSFSAKVEQTDEMTKETSDFFCPPMVTQQNEPANKGIQIHKHKNKVAVIL